MVQSKHWRKQVNKDSRGIKPFQISCIVNLYLNSCSRKTSCSDRIFLSRWMKLYLRVSSQQLNKDCWEYEHINEPAQIPYESLSNSLKRRWNQIISPTACWERLRSHVSLKEE